MQIIIMLIAIALLALYFYAKILPVFILLIGMSCLTVVSWYGFRQIHKVPLQDRFEKLEYAMILRQQSIVVAMTLVTILLWVLLLRP